MQVYTLMKFAGRVYFIGCVSPIRYVPLLHIRCAKVLCYRTWCTPGVHDVCVTYAVIALLIGKIATDPNLSALLAQNIASVAHRCSNRLQLAAKRFAQQCATANCGRFAKYSAHTAKFGPAQK